LRYGEGRNLPEHDRIMARKNAADLRIGRNREPGRQLGLIHANVGSMIPL
jgi:hypothetical protein